MISVLTGSEPYLVARKFESLVGSIEYPELNYLEKDIFDDDSLAFLQSVSLFGDRKVLVVRVNELSSIINDSFRYYLDNESKTNDLIVCYDTAKGSILKTLKGKVNSYDIKKFTEPELKNELIRHIGSKHGQITANALNAFVERMNYVNNPLVFFSSVIDEMDSLLLLHPDGITEGIVENEVRSYEIEQLFSCAEAIKAKNMKKLLKQIELISLAGDEFATLGALARNFRIECKLKSGFKLSDICSGYYKPLFSNSSFETLSYCFHLIEEVKYHLEKGSFSIKLLFKEVMIKIYVAINAS